MTKTLDEMIQALELRSGDLPDLPADPNVERRFVPDRSTFGEGVQAVIGMRLMPMIESLAIQQEFGDQEYDPNFRWGENIEGFEFYSSQLAHARNADHMAALKQEILNGQERRNVMTNQGTLQSITTGFADPINAVMLPFQAPATLGRAMLRAAVGTATVEAGAEAINLYVDPNASYMESTINIAASAGFGAAFRFGADVIGGAVQTRAINQAVAVQKEINEMATLGDDLQGVAPEQRRSPVPRADRLHGDLDDAELQSRIEESEASAQQVASEDNPSIADDVRAQAQDLRNERGLRRMEELNAEDPVFVGERFNYKASWFTNSVFFQAVTTPLKRIFQGDYSESVKEIFARSFNDNGMTFVENMFGKPSPQSVAVRSAVHQGRWVKANDELMSIFSEATQASPASRLDINLSNTARSITRSDNTFSSFLNEVSRKRILGDDANMSEGELKASSVINRYFEESQVRLENTGLLNSAKGMDRRIEMYNEELLALKSSQTGIVNRAERALVEDRIKLIESRMRGMEGMRSATESYSSTDAFFPRFFDSAAIRNRRADFSNILYSWYSKNPFVYQVNAKGESTKVELSTLPEKIQERVDQTIDKILGEADPLSLENVSFGVGQRQLNIPNSLVVDFMMTDPLAAMKTYAARIEPRYEFAFQFGKDADGVRFDLERNLIRDGKTQRVINEVMKDFNHMYDRTIGTVLRNPDTLSQKVASVLREAASFTYMGSSGIAALPDFGRIVMEYEMRNVWRGVQALLDKERVNMTVDEIRLAGEAIDILKGSAHMRLFEDMSNNIDTNSVLSQTRNAFYILNGLAPMTTLAKQLAGVIDAHQIIDYSVRLGQGKLDEQSITWLARYGIGKETAALIARSPYETTENGFNMANTEAWTSDEFLNSTVDKTFKYRHPTTRYSEMTDRQLTTYFSKQFPEARIFTDPKIVKPYFSKLQENHGYESLLGFMTDLRDIPDGGFSVHIDKDMVRARYERIRENGENADQVRSDAEQAFADGKIQEEYLYHVKNELDAIDMFETADDYLEYVMLHELMHSVVNRNAGESTASLENRIDRAAISYMTNQRSYGKMLAREQAVESLRAEQEETVMQFRAALNSGVLNTIMSGTPADKPIITDGVVYIPMNVASKFGMTEHPEFKGYARIENGLLGLPFQFYSFALANVNKTVGALAQGQIKNRTIGAATMLGLSYMAMQIRTPDVIWDNMNAQDKFARTFDMSGIMALYSDLLYTSMHTSLALGGPNITNGFISPKFNQAGSVADGLTGLSGAGPSWGFDMAKAVTTFASGDYGQGGRDIVRGMPFTGMWFWKNQVNEMTYGWTQ